MLYYKEMIVSFQIRFQTLPLYAHHALPGIKWFLQSFFIEKHSIFEKSKKNKCQGLVFES